MRFGSTQTVYHGNSNSNGKCNPIWCSVIVLLILLALCVFNFIQQKTFRDQKDAFSQIESDIYDVNSDKANSMYTNKIIKITSKNLTSDNQLQDYDFKLLFPNNTLQLKRVTQYCQWVQSQNVISSNNSTTYRYIYQKGWQTHLVNSFYFHDSMNFNPQRDPYPSQEWDSIGARLGDFHLGDIYIQKLKTFSLFDQYSSDMMYPFPSSPANLSDSFQYIGNGYFYSAYSPSFLEKFINVLNFQIGDLFSTCEAGDLRIKFMTVMPQGFVTVIGQQKTDIGEIGEYITSKGIKISLIREGYYSSKEMIEMELKDCMTTLWIIRFIMLVVAFISLFILYSVLEINQDMLSWVLTIFISGIGIYFSFIWTLLYGINQLNFLVFSLSLVFLFAYFQKDILELTQKDKKDDQISNFDVQQANATTEQTPYQQSTPFLEPQIN